MFTYKTITLNKDYYNKNNCRFVLCDSCWWFATIIKNDLKISECPICKNQKIYIEMINSVLKK
jgi:CO dehydrogenase/acetyl-CoA synthase gamma subunit (corrinoid Fe-S protein)